MIFKSIIKILKQNNIYSLDIKAITTDIGIVLIISIKTNPLKTRKVECWFHLKQNLIKEAKILGLYNIKNVILKI